MAAPYCGTVTFFDGIVDYYCDELSYSTPQQLYTTYSGEDDGRTFTPVVLTLDDATSAGETRTTTAAGSVGTNNNDDSDGSTTDTADGSNSTGGSSSGSSSGSKSSGSSVNVGAIAGGVVGGVAVLALLGVGLFFLIRHNKKKKAAAAAAAAQPMSQAPQGPAPPGQPAYNPHYSQQYSPQYPPQQGYFPDQNKPGGFAAVAPAGVPDRNDSTSPVSQFTDNRQSYQPTSPTSTVNSSWQGQNAQGGYPNQQGSPPNVPPTVHEAGGNVVGERDYNSNHHGQFHELG